ncbi:hypothetical protein BaRGS_00020509 [Batillaria attramentaria]|uniref:Uncharacterized protein n=1 Tax=Batillaria attramentaria TaxID=370345 RepID=A0ABD0KMR6_9CAEN
MRCFELMICYRDLLALSGMPCAGRCHVSGGGDSARATPGKPFGGGAVREPARKGTALARTGAGAVGTLPSTGARGTGSLRTSCSGVTCRNVPRTVFPPQGFGDRAGGGLFGFPVGSDWWSMDWLNNWVSRPDPDDDDRDDTSREGDDGDQEDGFRFPPRPSGFPPGAGSFPSGTGTPQPGSKTFPGGFPSGAGNFPGSGSFPSGSGNFPSGSFPSGTGNFPSGTGSFPSGSDNFPSGTFPPNPSSFPSGSDNLPSGTGNLPSGTGSFPSGTGNFPSGTGNFPLWNRQLSLLEPAAFLLEPATSPLEPAKFPSGTGSFPSGTGNFPSGTGNFPSGTGSFSFWCWKLPARHFPRLDEPGKAAVVTVSGTISTTMTPTLLDQVQKQERPGTPLTVASLTSCTSKAGLPVVDATRRQRRRLRGARTTPVTVVRPGTVTTGPGPGILTTRPQPTCLWTRTKPTVTSRLKVAWTAAR